MTQNPEKNGGEKSNGTPTGTKQEGITVSVTTAQKPTDKIRIEAAFKGIDADGEKSVLRFDGEGASYAEALSAIDFPQGGNCLVNITVTKNGKSMKKSFAPHKARSILEKKNVSDMAEAFRGL